MKSLYEILEVAVTATEAEIKKAYRKKARELHPDTGNAPDDSAFKELSNAYSILIDPSKREIYDLTGDAQGALDFDNSVIECLAKIVMSALMQEVNDLIEYTRQAIHEGREKAVKQKKTLDADIMKLSNNADRLYLKNKDTDRQTDPLFRIIDGELAGMRQQLSSLDLQISIGDAMRRHVDRYGCKLRPEQPRGGRANLTAQLLHSFHYRDID